MKPMINSKEVIKNIICINKKETSDQIVKKCVNKILKGVNKKFKNDDFNDIVESGNDIVEVFICEFISDLKEFDMETIGEAYVRINQIWQTINSK